MADFLSDGFISGRGRGGYGKSIGPAHTDYSNFGKKYQIRIFGERGHIYIPKGMAAGAAAEGGYLMMEKILNLIMMMKVMMKNHLLFPRVIYLIKKLL